MLDDVVAMLACPHCGEDLASVERSLRCARGHVFDLAKQGYVSLLPGSARPGGDTGEMIAARADFLAAGHYDPIVTMVAESVAADIGSDGGVLDIGAGTGFQLARVLDAVPDRAGVALDVSKAAGRRAAKAHARIGSVVADAWTALPIRTGAVSTVLNIFAPRNAGEMHRVIAPGGRLVVVTPTERHLRELVDEFGLLTVDPRKRARLDEQLADRFEPVVAHGCEFRMSLTPTDVLAVIGMGPNAWHSTVDSLAGRVGESDEARPVTASVSVATYRAR